MSVCYAENKDKIKNKIKTLIQQMCNTSHLCNKTAYCVLSLRDGIQTTVIPRLTSDPANELFD